MRWAQGLAGYSDTGSTWGPDPHPAYYVQVGSRGALIRHAVIPDGEYYAAQGPEAAIWTVQSTQPDITAGGDPIEATVWPCDPNTPLLSRVFVGAVPDTGEYASLALVDVPLFETIYNTTGRDHAPDYEWYGPGTYLFGWSVGSIITISIHIWEPLDIVRGTGATIDTGGGTTLPFTLPGTLG